MVEGFLFLFPSCCFRLRYGPMNLWFGAMAAAAFALAGAAPGYWSSRLPKPYLKMFPNCAKPA